MTKVEWFLGGILVILLIIVAGLALSLWTRSDNATVQNGSAQADIAPTPVFEGETALAASVLANENVQTWQSDALLYKASATWLQGIDVNDLNSGASAWEFAYFSPGSGSVATMSVIDDVAGAVVAGPDNVDLNPLHVAGGWKVDSPEAVRILMEAGGGDFLAREGVVSMVMTLTTDNGNGRLEWLVGLFAPQTENSFSIRLDATSGDVIEIIHSP